MTNVTFEDFESTASGRRAVTQLAKYGVKPEHIFSTARIGMALVLPGLAKEGKHKAAVFCGEENWANWTKAERRVAGMCIAFFARLPSTELYPCYTKSGKPTCPASYSTQPMAIPVVHASTKKARSRGTDVVLQLIR